MAQHTITCRSYFVPRVHAIWIGVEIKLRQISSAVYAKHVLWEKRSDPIRISLQWEWRWKDDNNYCDSIDPRHKNTRICCKRCVSHCVRQRRPCPHCCASSCLFPRSSSWNETSGRVVYLPSCVKERKKKKLFLNLCNACNSFPFVLFICSVEDHTDIIMLATPQVPINIAKPRWINSMMCFGELWNNSAVWNIAPLSRKQQLQGSSVMSVIGQETKC